MKGSPLLVRRKIARTIKLQESTGKGIRSLSSPTFISYYSLESERSTTHTVFPSRYAQGTGQYASATKEETNLNQQDSRNKTTMQKGALPKQQRKRYEQENNSVNLGKQHYLHTLTLFSLDFNFFFMLEFQASSTSLDGGTVLLPIPLPVPLDSVQERNFRIITGTDALASGSMDFGRLHPLPEPAEGARSMVPLSEYGFSRVLAF
ncbi:hypothetical protein STEG23_027224 [Scotinomys teguina]